MYIEISKPDSTEHETLQNVIILEVQPNGRFHAKAGAWEGFDCNPETHKLYDDLGQQVSVSAEMTTEEKINAMAASLNSTTETLQQTKYAVMLLSLGY